MPSNRLPQATVDEARGITPVPGYHADSFDLDALAAINQEKSEWNDETVFITEKVSYIMRRVIEQARKYYSGVYDVPQDEITGDDKIWVPLTEWTVESVVKSIDLDTKDITILPGNPQAVGITPLVRAVLQNKLKEIGFGQLLNDAIRSLAIDGTVLVKTFEDIDEKTGKKIINSEVVNLLNIWIDPAAESVQKAQSIIERIPMSEFGLQRYEGIWNNLKFVSFSTVVPNIPDMWGTRKGEMPFTEIWERWGQIRKSWITKESDDNDIWIEGHIIASGLGSAQVLHLVRENPRKDGKRPYEEAWYKRIIGRWYGRGVSEMLFGLQEYSNTVINIRKSNGLVLQNGIFLIRKGSGLTPDMISSISAGGGLPVTDINRDIKQLTTQDFRSSSYADEDRVFTYADRVTGSFDIGRGEAGAASTSATATLTRDRNIRDTFVLIQEGIGLFLERLIKDHYIPILKDIMKTDEIIRITGEPQDLAEIDKAIVALNSNDFILDTIDKTGFYPNQEDVEKFKERQTQELKKMGSSRFSTYFKQMFNEDIDIEILITDEKFNKAVMVQQLRDMVIGFSKLPIASRLDIDAIMKEMLNIMGIKGKFFLDQPRIPSLAGDASQIGRLLKELPAGAPTETTALENAAGLPQIGGAVGQQQIQQPLSPELTNIQ